MDTLPTIRPIDAFLRVRTDKKVARIRTNREAYHYLTDDGSIAKVENLRKSTYQWLRLPDWKDDMSEDNIAATLMFFSTWDDDKPRSLTEGRALLVSRGLKPRALVLWAGDAFLAAEAQDVGTYCVGPSGRTVVGLTGGVVRIQSVPVPIIPS